VADQKLGDLTVNWLTKFIRDLLERYPVQFLTQLSVEELDVVTKLSVVDQVDFLAYKTISYIGSAGKPAFTNSWVSYGAPYSNAGYVRTPDGWVELIGVIKTGTVGSAAFTLPPGVRPATSKPLGTLSNGVFGRVDIGSDGTVTPVSPSNNASVVLDGLRFKIA
jgi:hypothetical protein